MRGAQRAAALTQRLLAFSRRSRSSRRPVDVNRLVAGMSELLRRTLGETDRASRRVLAGGLWRALADPNQLENAHPQSRRQRARRDARRRQAHHRDRQRLSRRGLCRARRARSTPGQYVMIAVTDTGTGMTPRGHGAGLRAVLHHQGGRPGHRPRPQHGLRLRQADPAAMSRSTARSAQGTTVKLYLPRLLSEEGSDADAAKRRRRPPRSAGAETDPGRRGRRRRARRFAAEILTRARLYRCSRPPTAATALRSARAPTRRSTCCSPMSACPAA